MKFLDSFSNYAYALLRIISGFMFTLHGLQKVFGILASRPQPPIGSQVWYGGIIELICGLAVMFGFQTRLAAFLSSGTMAVAYFQFHWKGQMGSGFFPTVNHGELAVLYCFIFLLIACRGTVVWGIEKK